MSTDSKLFLSGRVDSLKEELKISIETCICLFLYAYSDLKIEVIFVDAAKEYHTSLPLTSLEHIPHLCLKKDCIQFNKIHLSLPAIEANNGKTFIGGLCAVLRWAVKSHLLTIPNHYSEKLLGFRGGCLVACSESSLWTKFCEIQLPSTVHEVSAINKTCLPKISTIPDSLMLLEAHLKRPVRTHNILKRKLDIVKKVKQNQKHGDNLSYGAFPSEDIHFTICDSQSQPIKIVNLSEKLQNMVITEKTDNFCLDHSYLEGIDLTLADVIVFPCVHYLLKCLPTGAPEYLENVIKWYRRMVSNELVKKAANICGISFIKSYNETDILDTGIITIPKVKEDSLYKRDPFHTKLKCKLKHPKDVLMLLQNASIHPLYKFNFCETLDWKNLPYLLHPATGDLPQKRVDRKCQQIESMVTACLKVALDGQTIVEFCAGGGHVGLLLAYFLPKCKVILIENKESSMLRAKNRAEALNLENVFFYQCNLDYFKGSFDMGVALHACGVATDLVIQQCVQQQASFVCCPCCYGGIQNTHLLRYPLSKTFCKAGVSYENFVFLAHCADRNEVNTPTADQGELCMGLVDTDRVLYAEEQGYVVHLMTLQPTTCSPKHNLLIGTSPKWKSQNQNDDLR